MIPDKSPQPFTALVREDELDALVVRSSTRPVLIFKHSPTCGTSYFALDELSAWGQEQDAADVHLVDVIAHRVVSNEIARRFGVRHQSPQVLLVRDGRVLWHASHYSVTAASVASALARP